MKKFEKIVIALILIVSVVSMLILKGPLSHSDRNELILIKVDNKEVKRIELTLESEGQSEGRLYEFKFNNNTGYVEVKNGKVRMLEMTREICPKAICSETGWIETTYQSIVCLPNKITVTIEGAKDDEVIDIIV